MRTYLLACDELPQRRDAAISHLQSHGITPTVWKSIHGETWGLASVRGYGDRTVPASRIGILVGHWTLWQHLSLTLPPSETALILEDDAVLCPGFSSRLQTVLGAADGVRLSWRLMFLGMAEPARDAHSKSYPTTRVPTAACTFARMPYPFGTHAMLLRSTALPILLEHMRDARTHSDIQLYDNVLAKDLLDWYAVLPYLITQRTVDYGSGAEWESST